METVHHTFNAINPLALFWQILNIGCILLLTILLVRFLRKRTSPQKASPQQSEQQTQERICKPLCEILSEHRIRCAMTQEFVAEAMGVSRQAVSKWENGTADPSTSHLLKLARLYGVEPEELLRSIRAE